MNYLYSTMMYINVLYVDPDESAMDVHGRPAFKGVHGWRVRAARRIQWTQMNVTLLIGFILNEILDPRGEFYHDGHIDRGFPSTS